MIRVATHADIDGILSLGGWMFERSVYHGRFIWDEYAARMALARAMADRKDSLVMVSERRGEIEGFVVAGTFDLPFSGTRYVSDMALVSRDGSGLWLLRRMVKWARSRGLQLLVSSGGAEARGYVQAGLKPAGQLFVG